MRTTLLTLATLPLAASAALAAETRAPDNAASQQEEIAALRQKIAVIERKAELKAEDDDAKAKTQAVATLDEKGLGLQSPDKSFALRLRGLVQTDARAYFHDGSTPGATASAATADTFILRRARPILEATVGKDYDAVFVPEFGGGNATGASTPSILDAYVNAAPFGKGAQLRIGKQKAPIGLDQWQSDAVRPLLESAFPTNLVPNRDVGVILHGEAFDGVLEYQTGILNGVADGSTGTNTAYDDNKTAVARVFIKPFANSGSYEFGDLGFGFATDYSDKTGVSGGAAGANTGLSSGYKTDGQQTFFTYAGAARANGVQQHFAPQLAWYVGPFSVLAEYVVSRSEVSLANGSVSDALDNRAWQVTAGWLITGENASFKGVTPKSSVTNGGVGAWEIVGRLSGFTADDAAFTKGYANGSTTGTAAQQLAGRRASNASEAKSYAAGVNWYLSRNLRLSADYSHTDFDAANPTSALLRNGENVVLVRAQLSF